MSAKVFHIPLITGVPELEFYAVVQRTPKSDDDPHKDHPGVIVYRSSEEMIGDEAVDVVLVLTTPNTHFDLAKMALENGKHGTVCLSTKRSSSWLIWGSGRRETILPHVKRSA